MEGPMVNKDGVTGLGRTSEEDVDFDYEHEERAEKRGQMTTGVLVLLVVILEVAILIYRFMNGLPIVFPLG